MEISTLCNTNVLVDFPQRRIRSDNSFSAHVNNNKIHKKVIKHKIYWNFIAQPQIHSIVKSRDGKKLLHKCQGLLLLLLLALLNEALTKVHWYIIKIGSSKYHSFKIENEINVSLFFCYFLFGL